MMALRNSAKLIKPERDSMVNMGENLAKDKMKELKKIKKEIVEPNLNDTASDERPIKTSELLPNLEESKIAKAAGPARDRYVQPDESEEISVGDAILVTESGVQSRNNTQ
mmetsp:Transcript_41444/g.54529  ORF Transcript_41444/g.54529 Transcript_41444/m.54529 type:complete len:110 (-) Transcript_41444:335-664(-)